MKTRKKLLVMVAIFGMVAFFATSAHAADFICDVIQAGPGWGDTFIMLSDQGGSFSNKWFRPRSDSVKEMLATALTAKSNNEPVHMYSNMSGDYPEMKALYLGPPPTP